ARPAAPAAPDEPLTSRQRIVHTEDRLPRDRAGVDVHGDELRPRWPLTWKVRPWTRPALGLVPVQRSAEREEWAHSVHTGAVIRLFRAARVEAVVDLRILLLDPADERRVLLMHENDAGTG